MSEIDKCAGVTWETADFRPEARPDLHAFSLVWDPKGGRGHVLVAQERITYGWVQVIEWRCECGGYDDTDHHTYFDARDIAA